MLARSPSDGGPSDESLVDDAKSRAAIDWLHPIIALLSLVHLTGDRSLLARYGPALDGSQPLVHSYRVLHNPDQKPPTVPDPAVVAEVRDRLARRLVEGGPPAIGAPDRALFVEMGRLCLGFPLSDKDLPMVMEQAGFVTDTRLVRATVAPPADFKVVVIGAGMIGINAGVKLGEAGFDYTILETLDGPGGTWWVNRFPNAAVDTPSAEYSFSFELNPSWSRYFPTGREYLEYVRRVADKYDVTRHIQYRTTLTRCRWDDRRGRWVITATRDGEVLTIEANAIVNAIGFLSRPNYPDLEGRSTFPGPVMHSAAWDESVDLTGARVVLVGTGCTAAQVATGVADRAESLTIVQRQPNWVIPNARVLQSVGELERWCLERIPYVAQWSRAQSMSPVLGKGPYRDEIMFDPAWHERTGGISPLNDQIAALGRSYIQETFADRPELVRALTPTFPPFAKRQVLDPGYFMTLKKPSVHLVEGELVALDADGAVCADGRRIPADVVILATGFKLDFFSTLSVIGRDGRELRDAWTPRPQAYLGLTVPGFPNFFITCGPNSGLSTSHTTLGEQQVHYVVEALQLMLEQRLAAIDVRPEAFAAYNAQLDAELRQTVFDGHKGTAHGYYRHSSGRSVLAYPRANIEYWTQLRRPDLDDYVTTPRPAGP